MHSPLTDSSLAMHQHRLTSNSAMMHVLVVAGRGAPGRQAVAETQSDGRASSRSRGLHLGTPHAWSQSTAMPPVNRGFIRLPLEQDAGAVSAICS